MHGILSHYVLGETKIGQLELTLMNQDILRFDVAVDDAVVYELLVAGADLSKIFDGGCFGVVAYFF